MIPQMNPIFPILCLATATHCWAEDYSHHNNGSSEPEKPHLRISVSTENPDAAQHTNLGFECALCGYPEGAAKHFAQALETDSDCILAHVGMLMSTPSGSERYREHLAALNTLLPEAILNPVEEWYLSTFLQYIGSDLHGAAQAFRERAGRYRLDPMAACWDLILSHYSGQENQADLLTRADAAIGRFEDKPLVYFARAILEESNSSPSENALRCARKAAESLPGNPVAQHLYGYLLARSSKPQEAIVHFRRASVAAAANTGIHHITRLSLISANIQSGTKEGWIAALKDARDMAQRVSPDKPTSASQILSHWEARTMLLRMLVLQPTPPAGQAINLAAQCCNAPVGDPVELVQNCLVEAIRARSLAETGRSTTAAACLNKAEIQFKRLQREGESIIRCGGIQSICYKRAQRACMGALYKARIALFSSSSDIWKQHLEEVINTPESLLLPPVLPHQQLF